MQSTATAIAQYDNWDGTGDLAKLPEHLRPYAHELLLRVLNANEEWTLSREEIVSAITSLPFRPILEQEAKLSRLGLAS